MWMIVRTDLVIIATTDLVMIATSDFTGTSGEATLRRATRHKYVYTGDLCISTTTLLSFGGFVIVKAPQ